MLHGSCHCGALTWTWSHATLPEGATACNCTVCRRYGALWIYDFEGDRNVGKGRLSIVEATPPSRVAMQLDMVSPMEGHNAIEFTLKPEGGATVVTWRMSGRMPFVSKVMTVFIDMDRMIGRDFESGLETLKALVEKGRPN